MEDFTKIIEFIQSLKEYVTSRPSVKGSVLMFLTAFLLFLTISIPALSSILAPMIETIRALIFMVMLTSGIYSISATLVNLAEYFYDKKMTENKMLKENARIKKQLTNLGGAERRILKYALNQNGNVWLPADNINVISLYSQGILYPMTGMSVHRGDIYTGTQCFAYRVSEKVAEYVSEKSVLVAHDWQSVSEASEMEIYQ